ncbi:MAG: CRTAC1 family protein [Acidobacteriota bacterium]
MRPPRVVAAAVLAAVLPVVGILMGPGSRLAFAAPQATTLNFVDVAAASGIDDRNVCGAAGAGKGWITETIGTGLGWLDFDGDGDLDLYLLNGSTHERGSGQGEPNRLFRNVGEGRFVDVTATAGVGDRGWGYGLAVGDIDNDGDPDLYVTNLGADRFFLNNGDGTFSDHTQQAGLGQTGWGASAAFFDMDADGDLDLYVGNYVAFDTTTVPRRGTPEADQPWCIWLGVPSVCGPRGLVPEPDLLYRNNGDGTFTDVSEAAGIRLNKARYALGVVTADYDNDGDQDVYVANDSVQNSLWRNDGHGVFTDVGIISLSALSADGNPQAGMGVDFGDFDGDGWLDLVVTNFSHDLNSIYRNGKGRFFTDESSTIGMGATAMELSWGTGFRDFDQDGDLDLFIANGHVYPWVDDSDMGTRYRQRNHLFINTGKRFVEESKTAGDGMQITRSFRAAAFADYDNDGDLDVALTALDEAAVLLRNDSAGLGHFLAIRLVGGISNRDGVGARVTATVGKQSLTRERKGGGSFLSASDPRLHFGLGAATRVDHLEIRWPSGTVQTLDSVAADQILTISEPTP